MQFWFHGILFEIFAYFWGDQSISNGGIYAVFLVANVKKEKYKK